MSVSPSRIRRVGPRPTTAAFADVVFSDISSSRMSETRRPLRATSSSAIVRSAPGASGSLRRNSGSSSTGATTDSTSDSSSDAPHARYGQPSGNERCAITSSATAGNPSTAAIAHALARSASQLGAGLHRQAGRRGGAEPGQSERQLHRLVHDADDQYQQCRPHRRGPGQMVVDPPGGQSGQHQHGQRRGGRVPAPPARRPPVRPRLVLPEVDHPRTLATSKPSAPGS